MWIGRLPLVIAVLAVGVALPDAQAQGPRPGMPQVEVRSLFGPRRLGWPVTPRPLQFGGGGAFGPRPDLGRGFSPRPSWSLTQGFPPQPASPNRYRLGIGTMRRQPVQGVGPGQPPGETQPEPNVRLEQPEYGGPPEPAAAEMAGEAERPQGPALPGESVPTAEPSGNQTGQAMGQTGQAMGQPAEQGLQAEGSAAASGEAPIGGVAGGVGSAIPLTPPGGQPSFEWNTESLRVLPAESRLAQRLRDALGNRVRSPLTVSIEHETAILRGTVATEYDRALAAQLARFEPGVRNVKNELTVAAAASNPNARGPMRVRLSAE